MTEQSRTQAPLIILDLEGTGAQDREGGEADGDEGASPPSVGHCGAGASMSRWTGRTKGFSEQATGPFSRTHRHWIGPCSPPATMKASFGCGAPMAGRRPPLLPKAGSSVYHSGVHRAYAMCVRASRRWDTRARSMVGIHRRTPGDPQLSLALRVLQ